VDKLCEDEDTDHSLAYAAGTGLRSTCGHSARVLTSGSLLPISHAPKESRSRGSSTVEGHFRDGCVLRLSTLYPDSVVHNGFTPSPPPPYRPRHGVPLLCSTASTARFLPSCRTTCSSSRRTSRTRCRSRLRCPRSLA